jgi:hypothetical protein
MFSKNVETLVKHLVTDGALVLDMTDEITKAMVVTGTAESEGRREEGRGTATEGATG